MPTFLTSQGDWAADPRIPHIVLVGLPGAGKSVVGVGLAERLRRPFLDLDREIERREGATIVAVFAERGEHHFRERERQLTEELRQTGGLIVSPGGGWITNPEIISIVRPPAVLVYLRARPETALARLGADRESRPLLQRPDPLAEMKRLLDEREPLYAQADHVVDTERLTPEAVIGKVAEAVGHG